MRVCYEWDWWCAVEGSWIWSMYASIICGHLPPTKHGLHQQLLLVWLSDAVIFSPRNWFCSLCRTVKNFAFAGHHYPHSEEGGMYSAISFAIFWICFHREWYKLILSHMCSKGGCVVSLSRPFSIQTVVRGEGCRLHYLHYTTILALHEGVQALLVCHFVLLFPLWKEY